MKKRIGIVKLSREGVTLEYYLLGSRKAGYGLEVVEKAAGKTRRECCEQITRNRRKLRALGTAVVRGAVFPGFLAEIVSEWDGRN